MTTDCVFRRTLAGEPPAGSAHRDERGAAFMDIQRMAVAVRSPEALS